MLGWDLMEVLYGFSTLFGRYPLPPCLTVVMLARQDRNYCPGLGLGEAMPCLPDGLLGSPLGLPDGARCGGRGGAPATRCGAGSRPAGHVSCVTHL
jgi:hypothetical protein